MSVKKLTTERLRQIVMEEAAALRAPRKSTKLTESMLRQIIKEELNEMMGGPPGRYEKPSYDSGTMYDEPPVRGHRAAARPAAVSFEFSKNEYGEDEMNFVSSLTEFCKNHNCETYEVEDALLLALGLQSANVLALDAGTTPEEVLDRASQVLEDLKVAYPGSVVDGKPIASLEIS